MSVICYFDAVIHETGGFASVLREICTLGLPLALRLRTKRQISSYYHNRIATARIHETVQGYSQSEKVREKLS